MKPFNKEEYNKLCAEFMGLTVIPVGTYSIGSISHPEISEAFLKYDSDWNWIMEVVEKIESLGWYININERECSIYDYSYRSTAQGVVFNRENKTSKKEVVVQAIWEFLNYYNKKSKTINK